MADHELARKRSREEDEPLVLTEGMSAKRPCSTSSSSYETILDFLDFLESDEENDVPEDVSTLISSLQEELSETLPASSVGLDGEGSRVELCSSDSAGEEVIRRLVEASDDELGIPTGLLLVQEVEEEVGSGEVGEMCNYDVFWELEEDAANYYMLQSEIFMT